MPAWQFGLQTVSVHLLSFLSLSSSHLNISDQRIFSKEQTLSRTENFRKAYKDPSNFRDSSRYKHLITSYQPDGIWTESTILREFGSPDPTIHKCNHGYIKQHVTTSSPNVPTQIIYFLCMKYCCASNIANKNAKIK